MSSIYHYCSVETFEKIISNKSIRMSDLHKTNDYMEKRWVYKMLSETIKEVFLEEELWDDSMNNFYSEGITNHLNNLENNFYQYIYSLSPTLISCFSKNPDKLSQWRAYSDDGYGVAIGFNKSILKKIENTDDTDDKVFFKDIIYEEQTQIEILKGHIKQKINTMKKDFEKKPNAKK